jgi:hypothetical protein
MVAGNEMVPDCGLRSLDQCGNPPCGDACIHRQVGLDGSDVIFYVAPEFPERGWCRFRLTTDHVQIVLERDDVRLYFIMDSSANLPKPPTARLGGGGGGEEDYRKKKKERRLGHNQYQQYKVSEG